MFTYSQKDLNTIDPILEPLFARAKEHAAQTEQLAMDATRLMSVRPDQFEMSAKQPFFKRLAANFNGQTADNVNNLYEMQRIGWRYIQILNERDLMMAHSMITVKNNLMTLAVKETETRQMLTLMANKIADRFEKLEESVGRIEAQQNIHSWLLTLDTYDYPDKYPEKLRLLLIVKEFFKLKQSNWNFTEIKYLQKALKEAELPWREEITLADFIDGLIDEIDAHGFDIYEKLITLESADGRIEQKFILENISAPSHKSLYKIADNYDASSDMIDLLADQLSISKKDAMKKVLRGFIEKEGIDTSIKIPMRDLAVELLGCHGLILALIEPSHYESGENYYFGTGVEQNYQEAARCFIKAAAQGNAKAQYSLGYCYANGEGVTKNLQEAVKWYAKSAEQGDADGQRQLGFCYEYGEGVTENPQEAVKWYTKSAEQGNALAQYFLGCCYDNGLGVAENTQEAVNWYTKSAEQGNASGQNNLGGCYRYGAGTAVTENHYEAVKWYTKAVEQGNATAQNNLGDCYRDGIGVTKDKSKADFWYAKAKEQGA